MSRIRIFLLGFALGYVAFGVYFSIEFYLVHVRNWNCTAAAVVKDTPPRVEVCTQYTRIEKP